MSPVTGRSAKLAALTPAIFGTTYLLTIQFVPTNVRGWRP